MSFILVTRPLLRPFFLLVFLLSAMLPTPLTQSAEPQIVVPQSPVHIGHGDGRIHIISSLSRRSVKNGEKLKIQTVIKSVHGIEKAEAQILPVPTTSIPLSFPFDFTFNQSPAESIHAISSMLLRFRVDQAEAERQATS
jgi:hypothetical protein